MAKEFNNPNQDHEVFKKRETFEKEPTRIEGAGRLLYKLDKQYEDALANFPPRPTIDRVEDRMNWNTAIVKLSKKQQVVTARREYIRELVEKSDQEVADLVQLGLVPQHVVKRTAPEPVAHISAINATSEIQTIAPISEIEVTKDLGLLVETSTRTEEEPITNTGIFIFSSGKKVEGTVAKVLHILKQPGEEGQQKFSIRQITEKVFEKELASGQLTKKDAIKKVSNAITYFGNQYSTELETIGRIQQDRRVLYAYDRKAPTPMFDKLIPSQQFVVPAPEQEKPIPAPKIMAQVQEVAEKITQPAIAARDEALVETEIDPNEPFAFLHGKETITIPGGYKAQFLRTLLRLQLGGHIDIDASTIAKEGFKHLPEDKRRTAANNAINNLQEGLQGTPFEIDITKRGKKNVYLLSHLQSGDKDGQRSPQSSEGNRIEATETQTYEKQEILFPDGNVDEIKWETNEQGDISTGILPTPTPESGSDKKTVKPSRKIFRVYIEQSHGTADIDLPKEGYELIKILENSTLRTRSDIAGELKKLGVEKPVDTIVTQINRAFARAGADRHIGRIGEGKGTRLVFETGTISFERPELASTRPAQRPQALEKTHSAEYVTIRKFASTLHSFLTEMRQGQTQFQEQFDPVIALVAPYASGLFMSRAQTSTYIENPELLLQYFEKHLSEGEQKEYAPIIQAAQETVALMAAFNVNTTLPVENPPEGYLEDVKNEEISGNPVVRWNETVFFNSLNANQAGALITFITNNFDASEFEEKMRFAQQELAKNKAKQILKVSNWDDPNGDPVKEFRQYMRNVFGIRKSFGPSVNSWSTGK